MPINLYSKDSVDDLLDAKLSISSLSNAATATLNAGVPTAGQALTYDGTDLIWATVSGSYLPLVGGTVTGPIIVDESATSGFTTTISGANIFFDGGLVISQEEGHITGFNINLPASGTIANVGTLGFSDSTIQTTAAVAGANFGDAFTLGKVLDCTPLAGYWVITFAPVNYAVITALGGLSVSRYDGASSEAITSGYSGSTNWTYSTTTLTDADTIFITYASQRSSIPISNP
jgi:hypothetical protein